VIYWQNINSKMKLKKGEIMSEKRHLRKNIRTSLLIFVVITLLNCTGYAQQATLTWLGSLGGGTSEARGVSDDGSVVVGVSKNGNGSTRAFRWTAANGIQSLSTLGGDASEATGISSDGSKIVGWSYVDNSKYKAFNWTVATGIADLGAGDFSRATAISSDGSTIVGYRYVGTEQKGFRFKTAYEDLGSLGVNTTAANGVSSNGSVVVGYSYKIPGDPYAFRWIFGTGIQQIGTFYSFAQGVSGDGSVVTGSETGSAGLHRAFKWTQSGGFVFNIAGNFSQGNAVSGDGSIIVGDNSGGAFRLSTTGGLERLNLVYANLLTPGSELSSALSISYSGQFIVGYGKNGITGKNEGYILAIGGITSVNESQINPGGFVLNQNYPNPFSQSTIISYQLPISGRVTLKVYGLFGKEIKTLVHEEKPAGTYDVNFDASGITPGIYVYKLQAGSVNETKKMILLK
jgi:probable HAF family extracellular repeat protein